jgi:hypothetical protein
MPKTGCWWLNGSFRFVILLPLVSILVQLDIGFDENEGRKDGGPSLWRPRERSPRHGRMQGLLDCRHLPPVHISDAKVQNVRLRTSFPKPCSVILVHMRCTTAHDCFNRVCQQISTDCSFMIFQLPEDMSLKGSMQLQRESGDAQTNFQVLLDIFSKAKKFPGEPQYRSVEVEVGLDMLLEA